MVRVWFVVSGVWPEAGSGVAALPARSLACTTPCALPPAPAPTRRVRSNLRRDDARIQIVGKSQSCMVGAAHSVEEVFGSFASPGINASAETEAGTLNGEQLTQVRFLWN